MKKFLKVLIFIILLAGLVVGGYFLYDYFRVKPLVGDQIIDGVYVYNLDVGERNHQTHVINKQIYYIKEHGAIYEYYKKDIYTNEETMIGETGIVDYCYFNNDLLACNKNNKNILYNYKFKKIYSGESSSAVPYKKGILEVFEDTIKYKGKEYRKVKSDLNDYLVYQTYSVGDNVYIGFNDIDGHECLYNVNEDRCEEHKYESVRGYANGLYYYDAEHIQIHDILNDEVKEYDNPIHEQFFYAADLQGTSLYYFDDSYLKIYDLVTGKLKLFDYRFKDSVFDVFAEDQYVYLTMEDKVYIIDTNVVKLDEMTPDEMDTLFNKKVDDKIEQLTSEYGIQIKIRKDADISWDDWKQYITGETATDKLLASLDEAEEVFKMFGKEFFKEFIHNEYKGYRVYIVSNIKSPGFAMAGEELRYYDTYTVIVDTSDFKRTLCHETMHALEDVISTKGKDMFPKWSSYNPKGFKYKINYKEFDLSYKYTVSYGKGEVYFIDNYAQTNELEDRARIFENMCMNTVKDIKDNPKLLEKAQYQRDQIVKYYPMLKDSPIITSLD